MKRLDLKNERGQSIILIALLITALIAFMGLVIDGGRGYATRRQSQNASDAAAFAGARSMTTRTNNTCASEQAIAGAINTFGTTNGAASVADIEGYFVNSSSEQTGGRISADCSINNGVPDDATGVRVFTTLRFQPFFISVVNGGSPIGIRTVATIQSGLLTTTDSLMPMTVQQQNFQYGQTYQLQGESTGPGNFQWLDFGWPCHDPSEQDLEGALSIPQTNQSGTIVADPNDQNVGSPQSSICGSPGIKAAAGSKVDAWLALPEAQRNWLIPIYDTYTNQGSKLQYHIVGFAVFVPTGYYFDANSAYPPGYTCPGGFSPSKCIEGYFVKYSTFGGGTQTECNTNGTNVCAMWLTQ